jgi:hypothetical protein
MITLSPEAQAILGNDLYRGIQQLDKKARVSRTKVYQRHGRFAWNWVYTVTIPGEPYTFSGQTLSWVLDLCKRKGAGSIHYDWQ